MKSKKKKDDRQKEEKSCLCREEKRVKNFKLKGAFSSETNTHSEVKKRGE